MRVSAGMMIRCGSESAPRTIGLKRGSFMGAPCRGIRPAHCVASPGNLLVDAVRPLSFRANHTPPGTRTDPHARREHPREVRLVAKAGDAGNLHEGQTSIAQQRACTIHAPVEQPLAGCCAGAAPETP